MSSSVKNTKERDFAKVRKEDNKRCLCCLYHFFGKKKFFFSKPLICVLIIGIEASETSSKSPMPTFSFLSSFLLAGDQSGRSFPHPV